MFQASIERRLANLGADVESLRRELAVIDEQLAHFEDEADDLRLRALVSETPLAGREHRNAARTVDALRKDRAVKLQRLHQLEVKQDGLLDEFNSHRRA